MKYQNNPALQVRIASPFPWSFCLGIGSCRGIPSTSSRPILLITSTEIPEASNAPGSGGPPAAPPFLDHSPDQGNEAGSPRRRFCWGHGGAVL